MNKQQKKPISVVGAVILNDKGEILCAQRGEKSDLPMMWEFPGGKIKEGESAQEALVREIKEELACIVSVEQFITTTSFHYPTKHILLTTFYCTLLKGEKPERLEHHNLLWCDSQDLLLLNWAPADLPTVRLIIESNEKISQLIKL